MCVLVDFFNNWVPNSQKTRHILATNISRLMFRKNDVSVVATKRNTYPYMHYEGEMPCYWPFSKAANTEVASELWGASENGGLWWESRKLHRIPTPASMQSRMNQSVSWIRRLVSGLSPRRPGFVPGSVHVWFVIDKVALERVLLWVHCFALSISFHHGSPYSRITLGMNNMPVGGRSSET
jgi:hypothetical protein